jgi:hypothetical protein
VNAEACDGPTVAIQENMFVRVPAIDDWYQFFGCLRPNGTTALLVAFAADSDRREPSAGHARQIQVSDVELRRLIRACASIVKN